MPEVARKIMDDLKLDYSCFYEEKDAIGKRYRRQDALGTPFWHHHRSRVIGKPNRYHSSPRHNVQERIPISRIREILTAEISWSKLLS